MSNFSFQDPDEETDQPSKTSSPLTPEVSLLEWFYESLRRFIFEISFFTLTVLVLLIALLGNGLLTLPYVIFSMTVILRAHHYYSDKWRLSSYLTYLILPYCLIDIFLQLVL